MDGDANRKRLVAWKGFELGSRCGSMGQMKTGLKLSHCLQVVESGRVIQHLQAGDSVLLSYGKAICRAKPEDRGWCSR